MNEWSSTKAEERFSSAKQNWVENQTTDRIFASPIISSRSGPDYVFAFHDGEEIGPRMLCPYRKKNGPQI